MGDMADLALEHAELEYYPDFVTHDPQYYWRTISGDLIAIKNMTTTHLENTLKMLERQEDGQDHPSYFALVEEFERR